MLFICLDVRQVLKKICVKIDFFWRKVLVVQKIVVPLHPLSKRGEQKERVLWKIYIDRSSTRSEYLYYYRYLGRKKRTVNLVRSRKQPRRIWKGAFNLIHWIVVLRQIISGIASLTSDTVEDTNLYNEEFDPGSGWTLATGLTHASRGAAWFVLAQIDGDRRTGE